jgi:AraC-like DNA-binding protein
MSTDELAVVGLVGSGMGAVLGAPLVWAGDPRRAEVRVLGAAVLAVAWLAALISARLAGLVPASAAVSHLVNGLGLVAFPLGVVYARLTSGSDRPFHPALALPLAAYGVAAAVRASVEGTSVVPFAWLLPVAVAFTVVAAATVWRGRTAGDILVPPRWVVGFMALVNVAQIARMDLGHVPAARAVVPLVMVIGFAAMVAFVAWRQVALAAPAAPEPAAAAPMSPEAPAMASPARYEHSGLDDAAARALLVCIDAALERDRLFARADLTLAALARAAGSTPHLVSEALNRVGGTSFRDLLNRRRVDDVKAQLADAANDRYTIEGLGAAAGFRSRSALYDAFRRCEGTTPTAFRDAVRRSTNEPARPGSPPPPR